MAWIPIPRLRMIIERPLYLIAVVVLSVAQYGSAATRAQDPYEQVNDSWDQFGAVYNRILDNYYDDLDQAAVMQAAIHGMLDELDSYSQFYDAEGLRQLRQDTSGKFAGLGITVGVKDRYPVVIAPIRDTPAARAGLLPGDLIVEIEGRDTRGLGLKEVVEILRGEPGTKVAISVNRNNAAASRRVEIEREIIRIRSVALVAEIGPSVGYIGMRQTRFSEDTAAEVAAALRQLKRDNVSGAILDLRGNPGGLLSQATQVADLFLPKGAPIVSIRDKDERREELKRAALRPVAKDLKLVVLIDAGSASAAEIVAGAIQDNDRGVIVGTNSFGKGSVQTIFDLHETESSALKLTTALYYTPSGRSIHRRSNASSGGPVMEVPFGEIDLPLGALMDIVVRAPTRGWAETALRTRFGLEERQIERILGTTIGNLVVGSYFGDDRKDLAGGDADDEFFTSRQRRVFGGGGIAPDVVVELEPVPRLVAEMLRSRAFFNFAVDYVAADSALAQSALVPPIDEGVLTAFTTFAAKDSLISDLARRLGRLELENLRTYADEMGWDEKLNPHLDGLDAYVGQGLAAGLSEQVRPHVVAGLRREFALRLLGPRASQLADLENDRQVQESSRLLGDSERYRQILRAGS